MAIKVPTSPEAGVGQVRATPLNTPDQQVRVSKNADMFGGGQAQDSMNMASALDGASNASFNALQKVRSREDVIRRTRERNAFYEKHFNELNRIKSEEDLTNPDVIAKYNQVLQEDMHAAISSHVGSDDSRMRLSSALEDMRNQFSVQAASEAIKGQQVLLDNHMRASMQALAVKARKHDANLSELFLEVDRYIDDAAPGLYPEQEAQWTDMMRQNIIMSKVESFTDIGAYEEARDLIAENPFIAQTLSRAQQEKLSNTINSGIRTKEQAFKEGLNVRNKLRGILGREPTQAEVMQSAGLKGDSYKPLSEQGKQSWDRQYLVNSYGENSPQVLDFDTSIKDDEMTAQQKNFSAAQRDGFNGSFIDYVNATRTTLEKTPTGFAYAADGTLQAIPGGPADPKTEAYAERVKNYGPAKNALNSLIVQTENIKGHIAEARKLMKGYSTGWGVMLDKMPNSDAGALKNVIKTLEANITLDAMKALKAAGATLGQQSDAENRLLAAVKGVFDPAQRDQLERNLNELEKSYIQYTKHATEAFNTDFADLIGKEGAEMMQSASDKVTDIEYVYDASGKIIPRAGQKATPAKAEVKVEEVDAPMIGGRRVNAGDVIDDGSGQRWKWNGSGWDKLEVKPDEEVMEGRNEGDLGVR